MREFRITDEPAKIKHILSLIDKSNDSAFKILCNSPYELFHFADNLDSQVSTSFYETYMKEYYEKRLLQLHSHGKFAAVHLDGFVKGLLPELANSGFDAVEAITPKPVGDVTIEECKELIGDNKTILWGGVPGAMFCKPWTEKDIISHVEHLLDIWRNNNAGFIVGSADQIPPDGNIEYCKIIADTIKSK